MCLALPGKIMKTFSEDGILMADVDFSGVTKKVCLSFTPEVDIGTYVVVHVGFAISILDEQNAKETLNLFKEELL
ncbi:MAG: HypC/HybG/HupF family hydrogenase formation chaperone [Chlamydiae bacterium]|nr:HypC/HybG/HupF family hydrogenase formation chaperone [Chlamydiota bacterium]